MRIFQLTCIINVSVDFSPNHRLLSTCLDPVGRLLSPCRDLLYSIMYWRQLHCYSSLVLDSLSKLPTQNDGTTGIPRMRNYLRILWGHKSKWLRTPSCDFELSELVWLSKLIARRHVVVRFDPSSRDVRCFFERFWVFSQISSSSSYVLLTDNFDINRIVIHFYFRKKSSDDGSVEIKKGDKRSIGTHALMTVSLSSE